MPSVRSLAREVLRTLYKIRNFRIASDSEGEQIGETKAAEEYRERRQLVTCPDSPIVVCLLVLGSAGERSLRY
jgi:hypothetical protein